MVTTIRIKDETGKRAYAYGAFQETWDNVLVKLLDACDVLRSVQQDGESLRDTALRLVRLAQFPQTKSEGVRVPV